MGGGVSRPLPMEPEARLARAREMGFRTDMPLYHGSGQTFSEFKAVPTSAGVSDAPGVSLALHPQIANEFALAKSLGNEQANPQVYKLIHRADNPASLTLSGDEGHREVVATLQDAFDAGHDAVMLRNYTSPGGTSGNIIIVKNPNQLRSVNAAFDPERRNDKNLLYSIAPVAGAGFVPFGFARKDDYM